MRTYANKRGDIALVGKLCSHDKLHLQRLASPMGNILGLANKDGKGNLT